MPLTSHLKERVSALCGSPQRRTALMPSVGAASAAPCREISSRRSRTRPRPVVPDGWKACLCSARSRAAGSSGHTRLQMRVTRRPSVEPTRAMLATDSVLLDAVIAKPAPVNLLWIWELARARRLSVRIDKPMASGNFGIPIRRIGKNNFLVVRAGILHCAVSSLAKWPPDDVEAARVVFFQQSLIPKHAPKMPFAQPASLPRTLPVYHWN